jgi:hypothetical protein
MSIIDLPRFQSEDERGGDIDSPISVAGDETDTSASGYVELKQLQHPLTKMNAFSKGSENVAGFGCINGFPISLSKVSLTRTNTPRDWQPINLWNQDDSLSEILESDDVDLAANSEKKDFKSSEVAALHLTPAVVIGQPETSASETVVNRICSEPISSKVPPLPSAFRKSPPTAHMTVSFHETMEVRYFYRSEAEIAVMKLCALERRRQQESRRRLRRVRQGMRVSSSLLRSNKGASLFYRGCSDHSFLHGMGQPDVFDDDDHHEDGDFNGSVFDCGMHFQRHDEQSDTESDDDMPLNVQDEDLKKFAIHGMVDGLSSLISDAMIDVKPNTHQNESDDDIAPVTELLPANVDDKDASDPWFISSLCGNHNKIMTLKE